MVSPQVLEQGRTLYDVHVTPQEDYYFEQLRLVNAEIAARIEAHFGIHETPESPADFAPNPTDEVQ
jgi:hypothetical protein